MLFEPRGTGTSTVVNNELICALKDRSPDVIYIDLRAGTEDPGDVISEAVRCYLRGRIDPGAVGFDIEKVGLRTGTISLAKGLAALSDATETTIAMVIEGVERALETDRGGAALWALKAARDQMNGSAHHGFRLIAAGADRDVLFDLVNSKVQAFYCAVLMDPCSTTGPNQLPQGHQSFLAGHRHGVGPYHLARCARCIKPRASCKRRFIKAIRALRICSAQCLFLQRQILIAA